MTTLPERIEPGAGLRVGLFGHGENRVAYVVEGSGPMTKSAVTSLIPGNIGDLDDREPASFATLAYKEFSHFSTVEPNGSWTAVGYAVYLDPRWGASNTPVSSIKRTVREMELPIYQKRSTVDGPPIWNRIMGTTIPRFYSERVEVRTGSINSNEDFNEIVALLTGKTFRFRDNGLPWRFMGADTFGGNGPNSVFIEFRFTATGPVPDFFVGQPDGVRNDAFIPALPPNCEYAIREKNGEEPSISVADPEVLYGSFQRQDLPWL